MKIHTTSFSLATYGQGNHDADKVAIVIPGRLDSKDYAHMRSHVDYLASQGFLALSFDPPGIWGSDGDMAIYTTTNFVQATEELIDHLGQKPTMLVGHSRGGATAMLVAEKNSAVSAVVAILALYGDPSPPKQSTIGQGFELDYRDAPSTHPNYPQRIAFKLPLNYFVDGQRHKPAEALKKVTQPKLLFVSRQDEFMELDHVVATIKQSPEPKQIYELDCEHDYRHNPSKIEEVNRVMGTFIKTPSAMNSRLLNYTF